MTTGRKRRHTTSKVIQSRQVSRNGSWHETRRCRQKISSIFNGIASTVSGMFLDLDVVIYEHYLSGYIYIPSVFAEGVDDLCLSVTETWLVKDVAWLVECVSCYCFDRITDQMWRNSQRDCLEGSNTWHQVPMTIPCYCCFDRKRRKTLENETRGVNIRQWSC